MKFGPLALDEAEGALLAHAVKAGDLRLGKATWLDAGHIAALRAAGVTSVVAARLDQGDVVEDEAAARVATGLGLSGVTMKAASTGRVNLHAARAGVLRVDVALVNAINAVDPGITLATLADFARVAAGQMVATVKIIPFAVSGASIARVSDLIAGRPVLSVHGFSPRRVGLVQTMLPGLKPSVLDKTVEVTHARLARSGSTVVAERRVDHEAAAVAAEIVALEGSVDLLILFGASAMTDFEDVLPAAIRVAGGDVVHAGMPVDPGNLLVLGTVGGVPVIGAPGCARSPKENGFDWILDRLTAGLKVRPADIVGMGVGGLLTEIATRPQPREARGAGRPKVHAALLAAGRSSRMGGPNKLMALFEDKPLVRCVAERLIASRAAGVSVVLGHQAGRLEQALSGLPLALVPNPAYAEGLSASLKAAVAAVPQNAGGMMVVLGDMPRVSTADFDRLIRAFEQAGGEAVVRASHFGKRGNPVILPRALFEAVRHLEGDTGARHLIEAGDVEVIDVELGQGAFVDVDTPEALLDAGGVLQD